MMKETNMSRPTRQFEVAIKNSGKTRKRFIAPHHKALKEANGSAASAVFTKATEKKYANFYGVLVHYDRESMRGNLMLDDGKQLRFTLKTQAPDLKVNDLVELRRCSSHITASEVFASKLSVVKSEDRAHSSITLSGIPICFGKITVINEITELESERPEAYLLCPAIEVKDYFRELAPLMRNLMSDDAMFGFMVAGKDGTGALKTVNYLKNEDFIEHRSFATTIDHKLIELNNELALPFSNGSDWALYPIIKAPISKSARENADQLRNKLSYDGSNKKNCLKFIVCNALMSATNGIITDIRSSRTEPTVFDVPHPKLIHELEHC